MRRWFIRILALGFGLLLLTGCFKQEVITTITRNGSGTNEIITGITKEAMQQMEGMGGESGETTDPLKSSQEEAEKFPEEWGAVVEPWEGEIDGKEATGAKTILKFNDLGT